MQLGAEREIPGDQRKAATGRQKVDFKKNNSDGVDVDGDDGDDDDDGDDGDDDDGDDVDDDDDGDAGWP